MIKRCVFYKQDGRKRSWKLPYDSFLGAMVLILTFPLLWIDSIKSKEKETRNPVLAGFTLWGIISILIIYFLQSSHHWTWSFLYWIPCILIVFILGCSIELIVESLKYQSPKHPFLSYK